MSAQTILPFPVTEKRASTVAGLAGLLGTEYTISDHARGVIVVRLCQLDLAAGTAVPLDKVFIGTTSTGIPDHQVKPCTAKTDRAYGIGMTAEALVDNDYFFVQVDGLMSIFMGDDGTDTVIGQAMGCDDDADTGAAYNTTRTLATAIAIDIAIAREVVTGTDESVLCAPIRKLYG